MSTADMGLEPSAVLGPMLSWNPVPSLALCRSPVRVGPLPRSLPVPVPVPATFHNLPTPQNTDRLAASYVGDRESAPIVDTGLPLRKPTSQRVPLSARWGR